jgi:Cytochrome C oxidase, cbb3-type, subunit III
MQPDDPTSQLACYNLILTPTHAPKGRAGAEEARILELCEDLIGFTEQAEGLILLCRTKRTADNWRRMPCTDRNRWGVSKESPSDLRITGGTAMLVKSSRRTLTANRLPLACTAIFAATTCVAHEVPDMSGSELYRIFCASCHGPHAHGDGPVAATLKPKVPDLTRISARNGGAFPTDRVREIIDGQSAPRAHGSRAMPVWGWDFYAVTGEDPPRRKHVAELINRLVEYLQSIQRD